MERTENPEAKLDKLYFPQNRAYNLEPNKYLCRLRHQTHFPFYFCHKIEVLFVLFRWTKKSYCIHRKFYCYSWWSDIFLWSLLRRVPRLFQRRQGGNILGQLDSSWCHFVFRYESTICHVCHVQSDLAHDDNSNCGIFIVGRRIIGDNCENCPAHESDPVISECGYYLRISFTYTHTYIYAILHSKKPNFFVIT